jgi:hypothetical protein
MAEQEFNRKGFSGEDIIRLKQLISEGCQVNQEIEDLKEGLRDTVKAIAEEIEVKPSQLNRAIRIAFKDALADERDALDEVEDILDAAGRK